MKKAVLFLLSVFDRIHNFIQLKLKHVRHGKRLTINGKLYLHGNGSVVFGESVTIQSKHTVNPSAGGTRTHITAARGAAVIVGNHVGISHCAITAWNGVTIEDHVLIGSNCMITDTDFHSLDAADRVAETEHYGTETGRGHGDHIRTAPVLIKKGAFIGARSIILKGVTVGENSIVGAGSVVTKSIPDGEIWAGNPAKPIRKVQ